MHVKVDIKKAPANYKCFKAGMVSSKLMHELHRAAEEAHEHDRGGTLFHLSNIADKAKFLADGAPSPGVAAVAKQIGKKARSLTVVLEKNKDLRMTPEESSMAVAQVNALRDSQGKMLKKVAGTACGAPEKE